MIPLLRSRMTLVWLLLVAATLLSWAFGHGLGLADTRSAGVAILVAALVKVGLVIFEFMEIRDAPVWMRLIGGSWIVLICGVLVARFLIPA